MDNGGCQAVALYIYFVTASRFGLLIAGGWTFVLCPLKWIYAFPDLQKYRPNS
jgi:hypothetical protein